MWMIQGFASIYIGHWELATYSEAHYKFWQLTLSRGLKNPRAVATFADTSKAIASLCVFSQPKKESHVFPLE